MESKKKIFGLVVIALIMGTGTGFYFGGKSSNDSKLVKITNSKNEEVLNTIVDASKKKLTLQKLDLLKSYTDFVLLPNEKIADPKKYANDMGEKVEAINNNEIAAKYYATGETDGKEQKIVDFLDYLNESIKADLN